MANTHWQGKAVLITGAGSGIGQALATLLAELGARLIITDINEQNLKKTSQRLKSSVVIAQVADSSSKEDWQALCTKIENTIGHLDALVNNAGMTSFGFFQDQSEELFNKVMRVNFDGVVMGCRECMPLLEKSKRGMIANVASIFGLIAVPTQTPYHASKFAVRGFSEALLQDMKYSGKNIDVVCVMPGGIRTNIANFAETDKDLDMPSDFASHFDKVAMTSPAKAAQVIEKGMRKNTFRILIGPDAKIVSALYRLLPTRYSKVSNAMLGVEKLLS